MYLPAEDVDSEEEWEYNQLGPREQVLRLRRYRLSTDNNLNSLREVRVRSQEFAFWELEESLNNEN